MRIPPVVSVLAGTFAVGPVVLGTAGPAHLLWVVVFGVMVWGWFLAWGILTAVAGVSLPFALLYLGDPSVPHVATALLALVSFVLFLSGPVQDFAEARQAARRGQPARVRYTP